MKTQFSTQRTTQERVIVGALIALGTLLLLGIQSLFLNHIAAALPADSLWRIITIGCFLTPPFAFAFLVLLKLNFSRSTSQDFILYGGMTLELLLFIINLIVSVSANKIEGTMLGMIGVLLGGVAGVVSAGTTAFTLAADPLRGLAKSQIEHDLRIEKTAQTKTEALVEKAMSSPRVEQAAEGYAEQYVRERFEQVFGRRASDPKQTTTSPERIAPPHPGEPAAPPQHKTAAWLVEIDGNSVVLNVKALREDERYQYPESTWGHILQAVVVAPDASEAVRKAISQNSGWFVAERERRTKLATAPMNGGTHPKE